MPTLNQLVGEVIIKDSGSASFDRIGASADKAAKSIDGVGAAAASVDTKIAGSTRTLEASRRGFEALKRSVDPVYDSQARLADVQAKLDRAVSLGTATQTQAQEVLSKYKARAAESAAALDGLGAAHGHVTGQASRMREGLVLVHEFLRGDFKRAIGSATIELGNFGATGLLFNPVTLGIVAVVGAIGLLVKATNEFEASQGKLAIALKATGDAVGLTRGQLDQSAEAASAGSATLSIAAARAIQTELLAGGRIGGETFTRLIGITQDYAKVTGESSDKAASSLNKMFLDPAKGAKELDAAMNFLTAAQLHEIDSAQKGGDVERARGLLLDALTPRIKGASEAVGGFALSFERLEKAASNAFNALGRAGAPDTIDEKIARLRAASDAAKDLAAQNALIASGGAIVNHPLDVGAPHPDRLSPQGLPATLGSDDAEGLARQINDLQRIRGHQQDDASAEALAAANRDIGKSYDEVEQKLDPLIQRHRELADELRLVDIALKAGVIDLDKWNERAAALQTTINNLRSPVDEARKRLEIERQVDAASPSQRPALRARLTTEDTAAQNPVTAGQATQLGALAGQGASETQATIARDAAKQAGLQADAEQRLATAAGVSTEAMRKATIENQVAAFAYQHGATEVENYRKALERTSAANQAQQLNAVVLALNQQADASARVAAVSGEGAAAVHRVTIENQAFAEALKAGAQDSKEFAAAYQRVLEVLQRKDATDGEAAIQKEIRARQDALAISQRELELVGGNVERRGAEVALLREKLRLQEQFPTATQDEIDKLVQLAAAEGRVVAKIKEEDAAERDFQLIARQGISEVTRSFEDMIIDGASLKDTLKGLEKSLLRLGFSAVDKQINQAVDKGLGSGGLLGLFGLGGDKSAGDNAAGSTPGSEASGGGGFISSVLSFFGLGGGDTKTASLGRLGSNPTNPMYVAVVGGGAGAGAAVPVGGTATSGLFGVGDYFGGAANAPSAAPNLTAGLGSIGNFTSEAAAVGTPSAAAAPSGGIWNWITGLFSGSGSGNSGTPSGTIREGDIGKAFVTPIGKDFSTLTNKVGDDFAATADHVGISFSDVSKDVGADFADAAKTFSGDLQSFLTDLTPSGGGGGAGGFLGSLMSLFGGQGGGIAGASGDAGLTSGTAAGTSFEAGGMGAFTSEAAMVVAHSGGVVGQIYTTRDVPWSVFADAPRFHSGMDLLDDDEVPAILQRGERVLNREDAKNYRGMMRPAGASAGGGLAVHIGAINVSGGVDPNSARRTGTQMGRAAAAEMRRAIARNS